MRSARIKATLLLILTCVVMLRPAAVSAADQVAVTQCGQVLEGSGFLTGDLDCSSHAGNGASLTISHVGTLELRGFTLTGSSSDIDFDVVRCTKRCTIQGPGTITGGQHLIAARSNKDVAIAAVDVTLSGGVIGMLGTKVRLTNGVVTGNSLEGIRSRNAKVIGSTITGNGPAGAGIRADGTLQLRDSTVTGNPAVGVEAGKLRAIGSSVNSNGFDVECGVTRVCADIALVRRPTLRLSSCGTSLDMTACGCSPGDAVTPETDPATHNFGTCALD